MTQFTYEKVDAPIDLFAVNLIDGKDSACLARTEVESHAQLIVAALHCHYLKFMEQKLLLANN